MSLLAASSVGHWDFPRNPASVAILVEYAAQRGLAADAVLAGSGLTTGSLGDPRAEVQAQQELAVIRNLVSLLDREPGVGLEVGGRYHAATFGIFGYACLTSPTLADAIRFALRYFELSYSFSIPTVTTDADRIWLDLSLTGVGGDVEQFLLERDLSAICSMLNDMVGDRLPLLSVELRFADPSSDSYVSVFGVAPVFSSAADRASFPAELLDIPLPQANAMTVAMCEEQCRAMVAERQSRTGVAAEVRERLVNVGGAPPSISEIARALGMSERTLRRRLTEEGTSYRRLLDEVHETLAEQMLATGALSVEDVAIRIGYAEASSFIAAFKRWKGVTPLQFVKGA